MIYPSAIAIHITAALAALAIGAYVLAAPKGTAPHKLLGRVWVASMGATAISSFWIKTGGGYSWIHLLSIWILIVLAIALWAIWRGKVRAHLNWMRGAYFGLVGAGFFTLLPHRRLGTLVWQSAGLM